MRDMEKWLVTHAGRDAEGRTGGSKAGSPLVILSTLRATMDFQTGNHNARLGTGMKRSHAEMLELPENVNLKSLEGLPVPFTDGKFFFRELDGPMRDLSQNRQPSKPVEELSFPTVRDSGPSNGSRTITSEKAKKSRIMCRVHKNKSSLKVKASTSASPAAVTLTPQRKDPQRLQPAVPIQPYPSSRTPVPSAIATPTSALNVQFSSTSATLLPNTTTDASLDQVQVPGPSARTQAPTPSSQSVDTHPQAQVHETNDVTQYDPRPVVSAPPIIRRPVPHTARQPPTWHALAPYDQSTVPIQYPPPAPQISGFGYMHSSGVPIGGVSQYETVQAMAYPPYNVPAPVQSSQQQSIPVHRVHQDSAVSWTMPGSLPPPAFAQQQSGHSNPVASYNQGALPTVTLSGYQHVPGSYTQMTGPPNQPVPETDQQYYNVHPVNDPYYAPSYPYS
jgi:hypothetical protein